jgi:hypothetical protein
MISCSDNSGSKDPKPDHEPGIIITSVPGKKIDHNREYRYQVSTRLIAGDTSIFNVHAPSWLSFDHEQALLHGTAGWNNLNKEFSIRIQASNEIDTVEQQFSITVVLGEIICNSEFGIPEESEYVLPFGVGESFLVNQSYCPSNPSWGHHNWFAYDFEMEIGEAVLASRGGEVIAVRAFNPDVSDCSGGKENFVFILHSDGTVMQYVHLKQGSILVEAGQTVVKGDKLGLSGNSGCSAGPHTHVALFRDRTNYDRQSTIPFNYVNAEGPLDVNHGLVYNKVYKALPY